MYDELVKNLRDCANVNSLSLYKRGLMKQAADAIEELSQIAAHHEQKAKDYWQEACEYREQIAHLVKERAALFEPALKSLELSKRPYVLEAPQPRWIPVTERLPLLTTPVLATDGIEVDISWMYGVPPRWITSYTAIDEDKLTHWMPLPQTPKGET